MKNILKDNCGRNALLCGLCAVLMAVCCPDASPASTRSTATATISTPSYSQRAAFGVQTLQGWYIESSGLYRKPTDWWNSANAITVLVDYSRATRSKQYLSAVANTFSKASKAYGVTNFTNDSNDDEGWWALAWIDAYDLTKTPAYLAMAQTIFADMTTQWDTTTCGGGVWWSKDLKNSPYKNAVTNELFLNIAASLANRVPDKTQKAQYLSWAQKEWQWFSASGMINSGNMINDGLNATNPKACTNNHGTTWTYNQGVILGGLAELYKADHEQALISEAQAIAGATMTKLVTPAGVLQEPPGDGPDLPQFKGVFMRNLARLNKVAPEEKYKIFVDINADSIWNNDRGAHYQFGEHWQGPFDSADGTRQTAALDALIAAAELQ
jgi:predicted alpha-1,6-mannanase (GH76 family)